MSTTIEFLGRQHQDVLERLRAIDGGTPPADGQVADVVRFLEAEVMQHFELEERALFPVLARHIGDTQGPLAVMNAEHATFRQLLAGLTAALRSGKLDQQQRCTRDLVALLRGHIAKEDEVLFPLALGMLSPEEISEVDAAFAR
jgi:hemerythrin-like domain-containing protein